MEDSFSSTSRRRFSSRRRGSHEDEEEDGGSSWRRKSTDNDDDDDLNQFLRDTDDSSNRRQHQSSSSSSAVEMTAIRVLQLGLRRSPPTLSIRFEILLDPQSKIAFGRPRTRDIDLTAMLKKHTTATALSEHLQREYSSYLMPVLVPTPQLSGALAVFFSRNSIHSADLNTASKDVLARAKQEMDVIFQNKVLRPDDEEFEYDKRVDFEAAEPSDWD